MVETWISRQAFENSDEFKSMIADMPQLSLDSIEKAKDAALLKKIEGKQGSINSIDARTWMNSNTDDSHWAQMKIPEYWDTKEYPGLDGIVWFRKNDNLSESDAGKPATLSVSMINDNDIIYINGIKVGSTTGHNIPRNYTIPAGILKAGENIIAIQVEDIGASGGIYRDDKDVYTTVKNQKINLAGEWKYKIEKITKSTASVGPNSYPTLLFNTMINPIIPYGMRGVIWYQGESNAGRAYQYAKAFPLMINDWHNRWHEDNFPFYFVQLASFNAGNGNSIKGSTWAELREAQTRTLSLPNTGMAITTDIENPTDIHPKDNQNVGKRL